RFHPVLATPTTGTLSAPRFTIACRAGKIFLKAKSPVAPKNTKVSEWEEFRVIFQPPFFPGARQNQTALRKAVCPGNLLRRVRRTVRTTRSSIPAPERLHQSRL